ncbi:MAG TPA: TIGR00341 family protein [Candidatus Polarisedimenticolia bacterium]|nr:TIGR00341 family protein [Candidatus Polarisedimenticolia bacterium]
MELTPINLVAFLKRIAFRVPEAKRSSIYESVRSGSHLDREYAALLGLSALIALFGLLQNSVAVIIGAMLISPLMNPLLAAALALLLGDGNLGKRSATVLVASVAGVIGLTWFVESLVPLKHLTPEILARTSPNLLDLFIAVLSGLAGTLALRGGPTSLTILPGVAIAVAVLPPLAVAGYGLSTRQGSIAGGAFLLFITNLMAIMISAAVVFYSMGFRPHKAAEEGRLKLKYRMAISAAVLLVLSIPLFQTLRRAVVQIGMRSEINAQLESGFASETASIADVTFAGVGKQLVIRATLHTTRYFEPSQIEAVEESLRKRLGEETTLHVDQILVAEGGVSAAKQNLPGNAITGGVVRSVEQETVYDFKSSQASLVAHIERQFDELVAGTAIQRKGPFQVELSGTPPAHLNLHLTSAQPVAGETIALLASQLSSKLRFPVQLSGQVELQGETYALAFEAPVRATVLKRTQRDALSKLFANVRGNPQLRLQITYGSEAGTLSTKRPPALLIAVRAMLARAGLKSSQWNVEQAPAPARAPVETGAAVQVRYDVRVIQNF